VTDDESMNLPCVCLEQNSPREARIVLNVLVEMVHLLVVGLEVHIELLDQNKAIKACQAWRYAYGSNRMGLAGII
jgi:hypothetical protein